MLHELIHNFSIIIEKCQKYFITFSIFFCSFINPLDKIKKRYGTLGQVLCYSINRGTNTSIGISLAGHRDRNKMACFVAGINPKGVAKQCDLEVGDEILEVSFPKMTEVDDVISYILKNNFD